jgi:hypothetical protein
MKALYVVAGMVIVVSLLAGARLADSDGEGQPTFIRGKFAVPISHEDVTFADRRFVVEESHK